MPATQQRKLTGQRILKAAGRFLSFGLGFLGPVIITFALNIGLLFQIPNDLQVSPNTISWLSQTLDNQHSVEVLVGLATIFIVFFAFAQLGYSIRHIPPFFIRTYLLSHQRTLVFIGFNFSIVALATLFSCRSEIHTINWILILSFVPASLVFTFLYFRWLAHAISLEGMVAITLQRMTFKDIIALEENLRKSVTDYEKNLKNHAKFKEAPAFDFRFHRFASVKASRRGFVMSIDLDKIMDLLEAVMSDIERIELGTPVGTFVPDRYLDVLRIIPILQGGKQEANDRERFQRIQKILHLKAAELGRCFKISSEEYDSLKQPIDHALDVYEHVAHVSPKDLQKMVELLKEFLRDENWNVLGSPDRTARGISISGYLLHDFITALGNKVDSDKTTVQARPITSLLYAIRNHALSRRDARMLASMLDLLNKIFLTAIRKPDPYDPRIATQILYLKEISGLSAWLSEQIENEASDSLAEIWQTFYRPLIFKAIENATEAIYYLILYSYVRPTQELRRYLMRNVETLFGFLASVQHWERIEEEEKNEVYSVFSRELIWLAIFMFRRAYYGDGFPTELVRDVGFVLAFYSSERGWRLRTEGQEIIDNCFSDPMFVTEASFERFEDPDLETAATNVGRIYNLTPFWIAFGIYRRTKGADFVPSAVIRKGIRVEALEELRSGLDNINSQKTSAVLGIDREQLRRHVADYRSHVDILITKIKN